MQRKNKASSFKGHELLEWNDCISLEKMQSQEYS